MHGAACIYSPWCTTYLSIRSSCALAVVALDGLQCVHVVSQQLARWVAQFAQRAVENLTDAFTGEAIRASDLFQCHGGAIHRRQPIAHAQDVALAGRQLSQRPLHVLPQQRHLAPHLCTQSGHVTPPVRRVL